ncbi:MAG: plastocyanin/azurin family copper-binding protein [Balneolaceae bacterium]
MITQNTRIRTVLCSISLLIIATVFVGFVSISNDSQPDGEHDKHTMTTAEAESAEDIADMRRSEFVADGDTLVVKSSGTDLSYDITEIRAKAGSTITIRYDNSSDMPHNIVFVNGRSDIQPVGVAGIQARDTGYVPMDDANQERIFAYTDLARPGEVVDVTLTVPDPGTYPYICTYPGHFTMMQGDLISEE